MLRVKTSTERFDEAFKMLLIIMTITLSGSIAFYKEVMEPKFFPYSVGTFAIAIILWSVLTLHDEKYEYLGKIVAWWFLMDAFGILLARLYFTVFLLPPLVVSFVVLMSLVLTLPILRYLKETVGEKDYEDFRRAFLLMTLIFIILDMLYFLGLVSFPAF